ncbi:MAG: CBS domain-containing protein [Candidatus Dadabacteria bacterium]|nr:CBS domain-containing protein [Candidatus Dadabacteria bacterium]TDI91602.1 MAG: CBS domain-containing protein [Candidatus Dadabacteria bacterium]TDJ00027.1 MAG: CBS domain-containing protein [Candidatus Dadabacteria bacterium]
MLVKDYMTLHPRTVTSEDSAQDISEKMKTLNYRQFPVVEEGKLVGIVTETDIAVALSDKNDIKVKDVMVTDPFTIMEDASIENASEIIRIKSFNSLPVVSENNELLGIITVTDILDALRTTFSFNDKPIKLEVNLSGELDHFDVLHLIQNNSEKVISFSSSPMNRQVSYFWVVDCDLERVDKVLRKNNCTMSVVPSE